MPPERRLAAILFADIVGFTAAAGENEAAALERLERMLRRARPILKRHHGREVKTTGDGFLVEFASARDAVECAVALQSAPVKGGGRGVGGSATRLRIGIHLGDVVKRRGDVLGDAVNLASRIEGLADPGGICLSQQVVDQVAGKLELALVRLAPRPMKNVRTPPVVYKVELPDAPTAVRSGVDARRRVAVLPFVNLAEASAEAPLADGLAEELIVRLARVEGIHVLARSSVMRYRGTAKPVSEVARELGVGAVVEGTIRIAGERLRITANLVDAKSEEPVWSQAYDGSLADVFGVQSDIARRIASSLEVRLAPREIERLGRPPTDAPAAYAAYLRGRHFWNRRTAEGLRRAVLEFREALSKDPGFALAHSGLSDVYTAQALLEFVRPREAFPLAKEEAERALALEPNSGEALTALGVVRGQYERDWAGAEELFLRAIELSPRYPEGHHQFADLLKALGRFPEALEQVRAALELDPLSLTINTGLGHVLYLSRRYDEAIEQYRKTLELDPSFVLAHLWFGRPFLEEHRYEDAIAELEKALELSHHSTIATAVLAHAYASAGRTDRALALLRELLGRSKSDYVPSYWIGLVYVGLGSADQAFAWFDRAFEERSSWLTWAMVEPRFDRLRNDRRFERLLRRMHLAPSSTKERATTRTPGRRGARPRAMRPGRRATRRRRSRSRAPPGASRRARLARGR